MGTPVNIPKEIGVIVNGSGEPISIVSNEGYRGVGRVQNRWRIDDEWWRSEISRMYYELLLSDGSVITVFQDLANGKWYQQRY